MKLGGEFALPRSLQQVYEFLVDPRCVVKCLPDLQSHQIVDQDRFVATVRVGLGRLQGPLTMKMDIMEKKPPSYAKIVGKGVMLGSKVNVEGSFILENIGSGATRVRWSGGARLGGRLIYLVGDMLEPVVNETMGRFVKAMETEMGLGPATR